MSIEAREVDLSDTELVEFVRMYEQGQTFICGGRSVNPHRISYIKIYRTQKKAREIARDSSTNYSDEWNYIIERGEDATRQFIKRPPLRIETPFVSKKKISKMPSSKNVFIVHGRDHTPLTELKSMLAKFGLNPIVLHEKASGSRTIVEKLEKHSDVGYAFVILTPDDMGCPQSEMKKYGAEYFTEEEKMKFRARQNVILEFGYFIGKLGRDRVCCLYKGDVELPSDMHGIVYIPFGESVNEIRDKIIKELAEADYEIKNVKNAEKSLGTQK